MKLRNKLIATIVSISMVLAVVGIGAWASVESFTATITNTVNLEFDNLKGQIVVMSGAGADNVSESDGPEMERVLYDGTNVIYDRISSEATSGTNLYWRATRFLDSSDDGLGLVNAETEAAVLMYAFIYYPTDACTGASTVTAMVTETALPEIVGGKLLVKYFVTVDEVNFTEIASGEPITPIADNEAMAIVAVCQYYNLDGVSISTVQSSWDFNIVFSAGDTPKTLLQGGVSMNPWNYSSGIALSPNYVSPGESRWEIIEFGEYPQTLKAANVTITSDTPDADGYYLGSDGERYAKLTATGTRDVPSGVTLQAGTDYYFKVEPIKWRVLDTNSGWSYVVTDKVIDGSVYQDDAYDAAGMVYHEVIYEEEDWSSVAPSDGYYEEWDYEDPDHPDFEVPTITRDESYYVPANNYWDSDLRVFVEETFYNKAFDDADKTQMKNLGPGVGWTILSGFEPNIEDQTTSWMPTDYAAARGVSWASLESLIEFWGDAIAQILPYGITECWLGSVENTNCDYCADIVTLILDDTINNRVEQFEGVAPVLYIQR